MQAFPKIWVVRFAGELLVGEQLALK